MHETVRRALPDDVPALAALLGTARTAIGPSRGGGMLLSGGGAGPADAPHHHRPLTAWLADPDAVVLTGCIDEVVVGLAVGHLGPAGPQGAPVGVVDCCYVDTEARQVGVGAALAAGLVGWFEERGCEGVDALALPGDRQTKQLWETAGFSARLLVLHRRLG